MAEGESKHFPLQHATSQTPILIKHLGVYASLQCSRRISENTVGTTARARKGGGRGYAEEGKRGQKTGMSCFFAGEDIQ